MMAMNTDRHFLSTLGLCARARALVVGTPQVCETLRAEPGRILCVLEAADTSPGTHKKLSDKAAYYRIMHIRLDIDGGTLGRAVGKSGIVAAVGVTDPGFLLALHLPGALPGADAQTDMKST